jgi:hypothetical protein
VLGETHPDLANSYANLGDHAIGMNQLQQAVDAFAAAAAILNGRRAMETDAEQDKAPSKLREDTNPYPGLIVAAYNLSAADSAKAAVLRSQAFEAAQWIGDEETARAIAGMSARVAAGNGELAARARERQDLSQQANATDKLLIAALSKPDAARNRDSEQALRRAGIAHRGPDQRARPRHRRAISGLCNAGHQGARDHRGGAGRARRQRGAALVHHDRALHLRLDAEMPFLGTIP